MFDRFFQCKQSCRKYSHSIPSPSIFIQILLDRFLAMQAESDEQAVLPIKRKDHDVLAVLADKGVVVGAHTVEEAV